MADGGHRPKESALVDSREFIRNWHWDVARRRAAVQLADGRMTDAAIAAQAGITARQFVKWKKTPAFAERVAAVQERETAALEDLWIADKRQRMIVYQDLFDRQLAIVMERAAQNEHLRASKSKDAILEGIKNLIGHGNYPAGGVSGLVVRQVKQIGLMLTEEFAADTGLVKSLLSTLEQAAKEAGQWETTIKIDVRHIAEETADRWGLTAEEQDELQRRVADHLAAAKGVKS